MAQYGRDLAAYQVQQDLLALGPGEAGEAPGEVGGGRRSPVGGGTAGLGPDQRPEQRRHLAQGTQGPQVEPDR
ncbi:hypothetical protein ACFQVA_00965 [Actinomadura keratinilytica]